MREIINILIVIGLCTFYAHSQQSFGGSPLSATMSYDSHSDAKAKQSIAINEFSTTELAAINKKADGSSLFAFPVNIPIPDAGSDQWTTYNGRQVYTIEFTSDQAQSLALSLRQFQLPQDGRLFLYNETGQVQGAYTHTNNNKHQTFMFNVIKGRNITLEYSVAENSKRQLPFEIDKIYRIPGKPQFAQVSMMMDTGFGASLECHPNIACGPEIFTNTYQRGVGRVLVVLEEGLGLCTGSLMNNTNEDGTQYFLSAFHCQDRFTPRYDLWKFGFNFEVDGCAQPDQAPNIQSVLGSELIAGLRESDFLLVKITEPIPSAYDVYFNGWDRSEDYHPEPSYLMHHPWGDIKKISTEQDNLFINASNIIWDNDTTTPEGFHFRAELDAGSHQPGSSGGPFLDANGRVIGQLHGGVVDESCGLARAYVGRFHISWDTGGESFNQLKNWLDPAQTDTVRLDGMEPIVTNNTIQISGQVTTADGDAVANVALGFENEELLYLSDSDGLFSFEIDSEDLTKRLVFSKDGDHGNGLNPIDLVTLVRHILQINPITDPIKLLAADANDSNSITPQDILAIQRIILGLSSEFPNRNSWDFEPRSISLDGQTSLNIKAYKVGDVNCSADPNE